MYGISSLRLLRVLHTTLGRNILQKVSVRAERGFRGVLKTQYMELTLKLNDGTIIASENFKVESASLDSLDGDRVKVGVSFLTNNAKAINALFAELHR